MANDIRQTIQEVIRKQAVILGPDIAVLKAREVGGLRVSDDGEVLSLAGDHLEILQSLVDNYVSLSGQIVRKAMEPLLKKHLDMPAVSSEESTGSTVGGFASKT